MIGRVLTFELASLRGPRFIINFPTEKHWRQPSKLEYVIAGLPSLVEQVRQRGIKSIAVPPLGCGSGGLAWSDVRPRIEEAFSGLDDVRVVLFAPEATPKGATMPNQMSRPSMTHGRASLIAIAHQYTLGGFRLTTLEVQKLMYFLQVAGENLRLTFEKGPYGPYADNLRHVLSAIDGHFIRGWGDGANKPTTELEIVEEVVPEARTLLDEAEETSARLNRVGRLIDGFDTAYGLELLSSLH